MTTGLRFLWLEITGRCQLECLHCYAQSSPRGTHGAMTRDDWFRVIDDAASLGVQDVQFIGGEPTLHPDLPDFIHRSLDRGLAVEIFSNLVRVSERLWSVFELAGVSLATSYYSDDPAQHDAITARRSHRRTLANIQEAVRRSIPLRVGVVDMRDSQQVGDAVEALHARGVLNVSVDHLRQVGRGVRDQKPGVDQLCGNCANGSLAVSPAGDTWPCVFSRWLSLGNVRATGLADLNNAATLVREELTRVFAGRPSHECDPDKCEPKCVPKCDPSRSCRPTRSCEPYR